MEDYKKKYEETLSRARTFNQRWQGIEATDSELALKELKEIFPELKESEEEKIRKFISHELACLRATDEKGSDRYEELTNAIAWLEKQGHDGKKWIYEDVYIKEKEQVFQDGIDEVLENPQRYGLEKQGEQKPTWSEEDEKILNDTFDILSSYYSSTDDVVLWDNINKTENWLKSLKERMKGK